MTTETVLSVEIIADAAEAIAEIETVKTKVKEIDEVMKEISEQNPFLKLLGKNGELSGGDGLFANLTNKGVDPMQSLTAAVCGKDGKALLDKDGRVAIFPHTITVPLVDNGQTKTSFEKEVNDAIKLLVKKTADWAKAREVADQVLSAWGDQEN